MNVSMFAGNVGGDPRLGSINGQNGPVSVLNFSLAVAKKQKDPQTGKPLTLWIDCSLWGTRADTLSQYISKGTKLAVSGEVDVETFQRGDGTVSAKLTCRVSELTLQGQAQQQAPAQQPAQGQRTAAPAQGGYQQRPTQGGFNQAAPQQRGPMEPPIDLDDDIPF